MINNIISLLLTFLTLTTIVNAGPVAEAEPEADPHADPGYRYGRSSHGFVRAPYQPQCRLTYSLVTDKKCATHSVTECDTVVNHVPEQVCQTVEEQQCHQEEQCTHHTEIVNDITTVEECEDVITEVCTDTQVTAQSHSSVIGHQAGIPQGHPHIVPQPLFQPPTLGLAQVGGPALVGHGPDFSRHGPVLAGHGQALSGHGPLLVGHGPVLPGQGLSAPNVVQHGLGKHGLGQHGLGQHGFGKREADADATAQLIGPANGHNVRAGPVSVVKSKPHCQAVPERKCRQVPVSRPRQVVQPHCVPVPVCVPVPRTACTTVARAVPEKVCHERPITKCQPVQIKVPQKVCGPVPVPHAVPAHHPVPHHSPPHHAVSHHAAVRLGHGKY